MAAFLSAAASWAAAPWAAPAAASVHAPAAAPPAPTEQPAAVVAAPDASGAATGSAGSAGATSDRSGEGLVEQPLDEADIVGALANVAWLRGLSRPQLYTLSLRGVRRFFPRYATIMREGSPGSYFYVILRGAVRCTSSAKRALCVELRVGSHFGEGALCAEPCLREATVSAIEPCHLLLFDGPSLGHGWDDFISLTSWRAAIVSGMLAELPFFGGLSKHLREQVRVGGLTITPCQHYANTPTLAF